MPSSGPTIPPFADLFYAVVIGYALSSVSYDKGFMYYFLVAVHFLAVLEDWYVYNRFVQPTIVSGQRYSMHSIIIEFGILFFWSLSFEAAEDGARVFLVFFSLFMLIRFYAGARYFIRKGKVYTVGSLREFAYLIPVVSCAAAYYVQGITKVGVAIEFVFATSWLVSVSIWWILHERSKVEESAV